MTELEFKPPFVAGKTSLRAQAVLYDTEPAAVARALESLARSAELARAEGLLHHVEFALGDSSKTPALTTRQIRELTEMVEQRGVDKLEYQFFDRNMGTAAGHNRLFQASAADLVLIENPDIVVTPRLIADLIAPLRVASVGQVEARQLPFEHGKAYDLTTGDTSWASGACSLVPSALFESVGRYDEDSFFLYCDDVDLSWRVRMAGYRVVFQPSASVFHDKRLSPSGEWSPSAAEVYYSAEAALILAHKYSRPDLVERHLRTFDASPLEPYQRAAATYRKRLGEGGLPAPIDSDHKVAQFIDGYYARQRFTS
ncbi:MAG TPA: glycosyltransferase family 2 protein [Myxococcales bacterium]